jgi:PAS domain S-box-containing protein
MPLGNIITVRGRSRPGYIRYPVAAFVVIVTLWLRVALTPVVGEQSPYISFFLTVVWASWFGGIGPGILATILSAIGAWYFVVSPTGVDIPQGTAILLFIGQGLLVSYFVDALRGSRRRIASIVESISDGFAVFDRQWRIIYVNEPGAAMAGFTPDDLIGQAVWERFPQAIGTVFWDKLHESMQEGRPLQFEHYFEQRKLWFEHNLYPSHEGLTLFTRDITDRKRDRSELESAKAEIEHMNDELEIRVHERTAQLHSTIKELEAFSYSVSHDLRAPLRAIDGFSKLLFEDYYSELDPEGRRLIDVIRDSTLRMGELIDGLLAFSRLGRQAIGSAELDMIELARDAFNEAVAEKGNRRVELKLDELPPFVGDRVLIRQVFVNLLSNAMKFTRDRNPTIIEIGSKPDGDQNIFYVRDNGVGFDMRYVGKLFGVFQRLHAVNEFEGTGLGLAIVQRIILRHGGRVWAEGLLGEGATIYFTLAKNPAAPSTSSDQVMPSHFGS